MEKRTKNSTPRDYVRELTKTERREVGKQYKWVTKTNVYFTLPCGQSGCVPCGFVCDGCSGGGYDGLGEKEWLVHDWLYATGGWLQRIHGKLEGGPVSRAEADDVFSWWLSHRWLAVRLFASSSWAADRCEYIAENDAPDPIDARIRIDLVEPDGQTPKTV